MPRFELGTSSLPRKRSTPELHRLERWAGDRVRTGDIQLGRLTLYQLSYFRLLWGEQDSNLRRYKPTDLQSVLVGRLSISPKLKNKEPMEGLEPTTCWLQISCSSQLSYIGLLLFQKKARFKRIANVNIYFFNQNKLYFFLIWKSNKINPCYVDEIS